MVGVWCGRGRCGATVPGLTDCDSNLNAPWKPASWRRWHTAPSAGAAASARPAPRPPSCPPRPPLRRRCRAPRCRAPRPLTTLRRPPTRPAASGGGSRRRGAKTSPARRAGPPAGAEPRRRSGRAGEVERESARARGVVTRIATRWAQQEGSDRAARLEPLGLPQLLRLSRRDLARLPPAEGRHAVRRRRAEELRQIELHALGAVLGGRAEGAAEERGVLGVAGEVHGEQRRRRAGEGGEARGLRAAALRAGAAPRNDGHPPKRRLGEAAAVERALRRGVAVAPGVRGGLAGKVGSLLELGQGLDAPVLWRPSGRGAGGREGVASASARAAVSGRAPFGREDIIGSLRGKPPAAVCGAA